jgi:hypothetical protein
MIIILIYVPCIHGLRESKKGEDAKETQVKLS